MKCPDIKILPKRFPSLAAQLPDGVLAQLVAQGLWRSAASCLIFRQPALQGTCQARILDELCGLANEEPIRQGIIRVQVETVLTTDMCTAGHFRNHRGKVTYH